MRRRDFIALAVTTAALLPHAVLAQAKRAPVIGILAFSSPGTTVSTRAALWQGLNEVGYVEGQNAVAEYRYAEGRYERLSQLARELVARKVDVLINAAGAIGTEASKNATSTIPVVFLSADDPVQRGFVANMARPGGNLTGFAHLDVDLTSKLVELAAEFGTPTGVIGLLLSTTSPLAPTIERMARQAANTKNLRLDIVTAGSEPEIEEAFGTLARTRPDALVVPIAANFFIHRDKVIAAAARHAIPAVYNRREFADAGGLISYGPDFPAIWRQMGIYAGRILNGEKPADLPVQQPTKFELVINFRAAKALGLTMPQSLLARADEVIE